MNYFSKFLFAISLSVLFIGCSNNKSGIEYLPVKVDKNDMWGFIDNEGNVFLEDEFQEKPSPVIDGIFSIKEGETYSLYRFDKKCPKLILNELVYVGLPQCGVIPVTKKDSHIEIIDYDGNTIFTLNEIDGMPVSFCMPYFVENHIVVYFEQGDRIRAAVVDKNGNVVIKPKYNLIQIISKDIFLVKDTTITKSDDDFENYYCITSKGKKIRDIKIQGAEDFFYSETFSSEGIKSYLCVQQNKKLNIFDYKGKEIIKCNKKYKAIRDIKNDFIIVSNENYDKGVINKEGEKVLSCKFNDIVITEDGFLAKRDEKETYCFYNTEGEKIAETDWIDIEGTNGFGFLANDRTLDDGNYGFEYIIDSKGRVVSKQSDVYEINDDVDIDVIYSDFLDYSSIINDIKNAISYDLAGHGIKIGESYEDLISKCDLKTIDDEVLYISYEYIKRQNYDITVTLFTFINSVGLTVIYSANKESELREQIFDSFSKEYAITSDSENPFTFTYENIEICILEEENSDNEDPGAKKRLHIHILPIEIHSEAKARRLLGTSKKTSTKRQDSSQKKDNRKPNKELEKKVIDAEKDVDTYEKLFSKEALESVPAFGLG